MRITNRRLRESAPALSKLGAAAGLTATARLRVAQALRKVETTYGDYEQARQALLREFGKHDESGALLVAENGGFLLEKPTEFSTAEAELLGAEVELDVEKFAASDFDKCDSLTAVDLMLLDWLVE